MREKLKALDALQKVDIEIAALRKTSEAYPKEIAELDLQLGAAKSALEAERNRLDDLDRQRSTLEHTMSEDKDKVRKWETRLTEQRTTREYSALAREIDIAKKGQLTMGVELVELVMQSALQREALKSKDSELLGKAKELTERITVLKGRVADVETQVKVLDDKRALVSKGVDAMLIRRYDTIRKKRMPALVAVRAPGICGGCRMNIPAQKYNELVASKGHDICPSCQRIIYAAETLEGRELAQS